MQTQTQWSQRSKYRPSGQVDWPRFLPWALLATLAAVAMGAGFNKLYSIGWYMLPVPILGGLFASVLVLLAVARGKCRSPAVGTLFGFLVGILLYGSYLYFGMLTFLGPQAATRLDLLPKYIAMRLRTDTNRDISDSNRLIVPPDPVMNGMRYGFEALWILTFTTASGYRRSKRSFCEQCGQWKHQDIAFFPPGNGKTIASWLADGRLDLLAEVPPYTPRGRARQSTLVALERCQPAQRGCSYYLAVKDATTRSGMGRFDSAFGRIRVPRIEITPDEVAALIPVFPAAEPPAATPAGLSTATRSALIEIVPIPPGEGHHVLTPLHIAIANILVLSILALFFGSIVGGFVGFRFLTEQLNPSLARPAGPQPIGVVWWLIFTAACILVAILSGFVGLRNSTVIGELYYRYRSRRSIARRREKSVDPANTGGLPTYFVQVVPRQNWGTMKVETATDIGYLQIDAARSELRFEGDVHRYRIPTAALTDFSIGSYALSQRVKYFLVVLQGLTASGHWEAPISVRPAKFFVPRDHRQQSAQMLHDQIAAVLPVAQATPSPEGEGRYSATCEAGGAAQTSAAQTSAPPLPPPIPVPLPDYAHSRPTDLKPRTIWGPRIIWRVAIFVSIFAFSMWRGFNVAHQRRLQQNRITQMLSAQKIEPGPTAPRLPLTITHIHFNQHLADSAPYYQPVGDWTILECTTADNQASFTVAIENPTPIAPTVRTSFQIKSANVALLPADRNLAARLVAELATALKQPLPEPQSPQPLTTTKFSARVLGEYLGDPRLGLQPGRGSWTALEWPMAQDGLAGQIYFNFNPFTHSAELVGAGAGFDPDALEGLASAIRDGPRPPRSEQNDPTFTTKAPTIADLTPIPGTDPNTTAEFSRTGNLLIYYGNTSPATIQALDLTHNRRPITLAQLDGRVAFVYFADHDDNHFLIDETTKSADALLSQRLEFRIWWLDRSTGNRTELKGPWGTTGTPFGSQPFSPDQTHCAIAALASTMLDAERSTNLYFLNLQTGNTVKADDDHLTSGVWQGAGQNLQYIAQKYDHGVLSTVAIDPQTGHCSLMQTPTAPDGSLSPDGQLAFKFEARKTLTLTPTNGGPPRVLHFGPYDRRFALDGNAQWLSPRYLAFATIPQSFIDVQQMKIGYLPTPKTPTIQRDEDDDDAGGYQYDPNFKWALAYTPNGLILGRVALPADEH